MKKKLILPLLLLLLFIPSSVFAIDVYIDGQVLQMDVKPQIVEDRTLAPLRAIFEAVGAEVSWDADTQTATGIKDDTTVILQVGSLMPTINGQVKPLDVPATIVSGRTLAPLRFVGEAFGGSVRWDAATQTIYITSAGVAGADALPLQVKVHYIDVGQADSIYIQLPDHVDILIDGGNRAGGATVVSYLQAQGVDDIELLIATHPHEDHIGGLPSIYSAFVVEQTIDSGYYTDSQICAAFKQAAEGSGVYTADNYQQFVFGNVAFDILTGDQSWGSNVNNYSVICRMDTGDIEFLFTGDAETQAESALTGEIASEILKVGHHGSKTSTGTAFLSKVNPEVAIISCGTGNTYGHPDQETLARLQSAGIEIYRTDLNGTIVVTTDGITYSVTTQKESLAASAPQLTTPIAGQYVGSTTSDKYHLPTCRYAESIKDENRIWFASKEDAESQGYVPCGICKP